MNGLISGLNATRGPLPVAVDEEGRLIVSLNLGSVGGFVAPPAHNEDFTTLPGGVAPTQGQYVAIDGNTIWSIVAGETVWSESERTVAE